MCDESLFPSDDVLPISIQGILTAISSSTIHVSKLSINIKIITLVKLTNQ
jgi:hypothetical protein